MNCDKKIKKPIRIMNGYPREYEIETSSANSVEDLTK